jgi:uncharacterized protein YukE
MHPEALEAYRRVISDQRAEIAKIQSALASVQLTSDAFGHLPDAQNLYAAYQEHADAEKENLADLREVLAHAAHGLDVTAQNYQEQDDEIATGFGGGR